MHAGRLQVDDQLAEALALVGDLVTRSRAAQHDDPVVLVGRCRPDLATVEHPAVAVADGLRRDRRQIAATVGLAHADAERQLAAADAGEESLLLLLGAELGDHRARLPVGHPVMADRGAPAQQLLDDDEAIDGRAIVAAVLLGQCHAQPATLAELARERRDPSPRSSRARVRTSHVEVRTRGTRRPRAAARVRRPSARPAGSRSRPTAQMRSMIVAVPMPPPVHIVMRAVLRSRRSSSSSAVWMRMPPVAPIG